MESNVDTEIQFSGLKSGIYHYDYTLDDSFFSDFKNEKILGGKVFFDVKLEKNERVMLFFFAYSGKVRTTCDRCLEELEWPVEGEETICVKLSDTETSDDENVVILPESAYKIDLAQLMYEFVAVAMPIQCIHPDDAKGNSTCNPEMLKYISEEQSREDDETELKNEETETRQEEIDPRWEAQKLIIMPHPKHRFSQTRTRKRRTHDSLEVPQLTTCSNCGAQILMHHVCPECGYYRGKLAIEKKAEA